MFAICRHGGATLNIFDIFDILSIFNLLSVLNILSDLGRARPTRKVDHRTCPDIWTNFQFNIASGDREERSIEAQDNPKLKR